MLFWKTENKIEPKKDFYSKIKEYYIGLSDNQIPNELLDEIILKVTDQIYGDYKRFWKQYPKSRKRYSTLKMDDIEHPSIHFMVTDFLNQKKISKSREYSKILFKMNDEEFDKHLDYKNWYETK
ncbi:hypothetical protein SAMN04488008_1161 [Maribacter orientalis]|uniref:Uncharacterized protein n=1 Tax=Maribacter orientalis TaxID=228957 RepID=A0A1H7XF61_9FLAO|nr:hypothetical protein [Maribacter orientalis]SEM31817.1 hypothetical protein SAMN04488008_1161 [Maribacter orientalis]